MQRLTSFFILIIISIYAHLTFSLTNKTKIIKVGALFSPFNPDGSRNETGCQGLAGFLMALDEINNRTDILPNHRLEFVLADPLGEGDLVGSTEAAIHLSTVAFGGSGVDLVIGGVDNYQTMTTNTIFNNYQKIQISALASSGLMSVGSDYPYKFRVVPSDTFSGMSNQNFGLYRMGYTRVLTFATDDFTQLKGVSDLNDQTWAVPVFLDQIVLDPTKKRFLKAIAQAKASGAQVFFIYADAATTGRLLEQGYTMGLFREGTIVFGCYENSGPAVYGSMSAGAPVEKIMRGYLGLERIPNYSVLNPDPNSVGQQWYTNWRLLNATMRQDGQGNVVCASRVDASGAAVLTSNRTGAVRCAGFDFSAGFNASGAGLTPAAPHAYDAVYSAAYALHSLLYAVGAPNVTTDALMDQLKLNVSYHGATGLIEFNAGMILVNGMYVNVGTDIQTDDGVNSGGLNDFFARGDREVGNHFKILNFNAESYRADPGSGGFVQVGLFNVEDRFQLCGDSDPSTLLAGDPLDCSLYHGVQYNTADNSKPRERPPPVTTSMISAELQTILIVFVAFGGLLVVIMSAVLFVRRGDQLVKTVQPPMVFLILFGLLVALCRAIIPLFPISDDSCRAEQFVGHFAFFIVFVTLYVKTWRINRLMVMSALKKVKITTTDAMLRVAAAIGALAVCLVIVVAVGGTKVVSFFYERHNQEYYDLYCGANIPALEVALIVVEIINLVMAASLARTVSELPGAVNESKNVLAALLCIVVCAGIAYPISAAGIVDVIFSRFMIAMAFAITVITTVISLYGLRVYMLLQGYKVSNSFRVAGSNKSDTDTAAEEKKQLHAISKRTLKAIKDEKGKMELCARQIEMWYSYLSVLSHSHGEDGDQNNDLWNMVSEGQAVLGSSKGAKNKPLFLSSSAHDYSAGLPGSSVSVRPSQGGSVSLAAKSHSGKLNRGGLSSVESGGGGVAEAGVKLNQEGVSSGEGVVYQL